MEQSPYIYPAEPEEVVVEQAVDRPWRQAYHVLHFAFTVAPLIAGLDKFFHILVNWDQYLAPWVNRLVGGNGHGLMLIAGIVEVIAGIGVALWPRVFGWVVAAWLFGIVVNFLTFPGYYDIALRDFGLALGAIALARLASAAHAARKQQRVVETVRVDNRRR